MEPNQNQIEKSQTRFKKSHTKLIKVQTKFEKNPNQIKKGVQPWDRILIQLLIDFDERNLK